MQKIALLKIKKIGKIAKFLDFINPFSTFFETPKLLNFWCPKMSKNGVQSFLKIKYFKNLF